MVTTLASKSGGTVMIVMLPEPRNWPEHTMHTVHSPAVRACDYADFHSFAIPPIVHIFILENTIYCTFVENINIAKLVMLVRLEYKYVVCNTRDSSKINIL